MTNSYISVMNPASEIVTPAVSALGLAALSERQEEVPPPTHFPLAPLRP